MSDIRERMKGEIVGEKLKVEILGRNKGGDCRK